MAIIKNTYNPVAIQSVKATVDITANRFISFAGGILGNELKALGVAEVKAASGDMFPVITIGTAIIETSMAINVGDNIASDASGKGKLAVALAPINGRALTSTASAGFVTINLVP